MSWTKEDVAFCEELAELFHARWAGGQAEIFARDLAEDWSPERAVTPPSLAADVKQHLSGLRKRLEKPEDYGLGHLPPLELIPLTVTAMSRPTPRSEEEAKPLVAGLAGSRGTHGFHVVTNADADFYWQAHFNKNLGDSTAKSRHNLDGLEKLTDNRRLSLVRAREMARPAAFQHPLLGPDEDEQPEQVTG